MLSTISSDSKMAWREKNIGIKSILIEWKDEKNYRNEWKDEKNYRKTTTYLHYFVKKLVTKHKK